MKKEKSSLKSFLGRNDVGTLIASTLLFLIFTITSDSFFSAYNLFNVARTSSLYVFIALGQVVVLLVGGMNLSLGAIGGLSVITAGHIIDKMGIDPAIAIVGALIVGSFAGLINGLLITRLKLNSFVVTLATSFIFTGLVLGLSKGYPYTNIPKSFTLIGRKGIGGVPLIMIFMISVLLIIAYIFKYTVIGRKLLATGGNERAARLSGINTDKIIIVANTASGFFSALAGLLFISRMGSATPTTGGDWMIISFAVAVIGGTALTGGEVKPLGIFASGILMALIKNGLIMLGVNVYFEQTFLGFIILLAVSLETIRGNLGFLKQYIFRESKEKSAKNSSSVKA